MDDQVQWFCCSKDPRPGQTNAGLYRRTRQGGHSRDIARARNLAQSVSRLRRDDPLSGVLLGLPETGLPDYGTITIQYKPRKACIELKSLKLYLLAYRNLGIFYENAVNKMLHDLVAALEPEWCVVKGEFTPRGGLTTSVFARWPERRGRASRRK